MSDSEVAHRCSYPYALCTLILGVYKDAGGEEHMVTEEWGRVGRMSVLSIRNDSALHCVGR